MRKETMTLLPRMPLMTPALFVVLTLFSFLSSFGCSTTNDRVDVQNENRNDSSSVVATAGELIVTASEVKSSLPNPAISEAQIITKATVENRVRDKIFEEVLYQEALKRKVDQQPKMRGRIRHMLGTQLIEDYLQKQVWDKNVTQEELQEYYDEHWHEFNRPDQISVADIFIAVPAEASDEEKAKLKKKAGSILQKARTIKYKRNRLEFLELIKAYSDTPRKYKKGGTGYFDAQGNPLGLENSLVEAAFALERIGDMAEHVVETTDGYHIIKLMGKRPGMTIPLHNVRHNLGRRMRQEAAAEAKQDFIDQLKGEYGAWVNQALLDEIWNDFDMKRREGRANVLKKIELPKQGVAPPRFPDDEDDEDDEKE